MSMENPKGRKRSSSSTSPSASNDDLPLSSPFRTIDFILKNGGKASGDLPGQPPRATDPARPAAVSRKPFRFIDLFCGIGGFRLAFERAGAKCVFSSDWDKFSRQTYAANFGEEPAGDINAIPVADIPAHDILCGGFPCQPFSLA